jgi:Protein of unknown function (DUF3311)
VTRYTEGFSHFVTSMTAPVASGWSVRRVGLSPTGKRRLLTAHASSSHSPDARRHRVKSTHGGRSCSISERKRSAGERSFIARVPSGVRRDAVANASINSCGQLARLHPVCSLSLDREPAYRRVLMKTIHWLAVIPFIGMLAGPAVHNEIDPFILGMPFPLGWISVWVVLTAIIMAVVYLIDPANREDAP